MKRILFTFLFQIACIDISYSQCSLTPVACTGTEMASSGSVTIPSGTTYKISSGNSSSATVTFTDATSILCIEGTWTGKPAGVSPGGGKIDVYGTISNATAWGTYSGGALTLNVYEGGTMTINSFATSGGTYAITNCGDITFTAATGISSNGGTFTINNYAAININGTLNNSNNGFTFNNRTGSQLYIGSNFTFSNGSFINSGKLCVTATTNFSGGTFTNSDCFRTTSYTISGSGAFTNNNYITVVGNLSNSGSNNTNNGTLIITGNYSGSGNFNLGAGSLLTSVDWSLGGTLNGPGTGCAQIRATGATSLSGTISAGNSGRVYFIDSGVPAAGFDILSGSKNSTNVNNNGCAPTSYPACTMAGSACTSVLPIELVQFKTDCNNGNIDLFWTTATETNNDYFTIERTKDGSSYETVGVVNSKAINGTSSQTLSYAITDHSFPREDLNNSVVYYRLKQTDYDGNFTYSYLVPGSCSSYCISSLAVTNENNLINIHIAAICNSNIDLSIYNTLGQIVSTQHAYIESGNNTISLDRDFLANHLYIVRASTRNQVLQEKFIR